MDIQNNSIVTDADTDVLDSQITQISNDFAETYYFDNEQQEELEMLVAKCMKLGELYERKKWQAAKTQAVPEWISVDDELPSEGDLLLAISTTKLAKFNVYQVVALDEFDDCEITHWMHLPQAPKAQEQSHE